MRPLIGITTSLNRTDDGVLEQRLDLRYVRAIERAGGLPVLVPMLAGEDATLEFVERIDGLVVSGGPAVLDGLIGELPEDISETEAERVQSDRRVLRAFLDAQRPVLGICYGMQLANALGGGTIYADVERDTGSETHSRGRGGKPHPIELVAGTRLHQLVGAPQVEVNTRHVQAVAEPGDGLVISARAPDGTIEGLESLDGTFLGVQFHPEGMDPPLDALFTDLVDRARKISPTGSEPGRRDN